MWGGRAYAVRGLSPQLAGLQLAVDRPDPPAGSLLMSQQFRLASPKTKIVEWAQMETVLTAGLGVLLGV